MLTIIFSIFILLSVIQVSWKLWFNENIPTEPPDISGRLPLIGHGLRLLCKDHYTYLKDISEECLKKGGLTKCWIGFVESYFITDPEAILKISNTCLEKHYIYKFIKPFLGDGLVTANELTWKSHRKLLNPTFSIPFINGLIYTFNSQARKLLDNFDLHLDKPHDHINSIKAWNLETICLTTTGMQYNENNNIRANYLYLMDVLMNMFDERLQKIWLHNDFIYKISNFKKRNDTYIKEINLFSQLIIAKMKDVKETTQQETENLKPFLAHVLDINKKHDCFTDQQIQDETNTIISTGFDTTATTLNILFVVLGSYPNVQQKVYDEIFQVMGKSDRDLNKDDLPKFIFTEAVMKETLRLYPIVPIVGRHIDKDIKLKNFTLKKNTACFMSMYGLNRNPNWGPDADEFRPERWLDSATLPDHNSFGTFSVGKRNCIGKAYALIFMKIILINVIRKYQISADISKVVFKFGVMVSPVSGHQFTLKRREDNC